MAALNCTNSPVSRHFISFHKFDTVKKQCACTGEYYIKELQFASKFTQGSFHLSTLIDIK